MGLVQCYTAAPEQITGKLSPKRTLLVNTPQKQVLLLAGVITGENKVAEWKTILSVTSVRFDVTESLLLTLTACLSEVRPCQRSY